MISGQQRQLLLPWLRFFHSNLTTARTANVPFCDSHSLICFCLKQIAFTLLCQTKVFKNTSALVCFLAGSNKSFADSLWACSATRRSRRSSKKGSTTRRRQSNCKSRHLDACFHIVKPDSVTSFSKDCLLVAGRRPL